MDLALMNDIKAHYRRYNFQIWLNILVQTTKNIQLNKVPFYLKLTNIWKLLEWLIHFIKFISFQSNYLTLHWFYFYMFLNKLKDFNMIKVLVRNFNLSHLKLEALVRKKNNDAIDGYPFIIGIITILKQFHS